MKTKTKEITTLKALRVALERIPEDQHKRVTCALIGHAKIVSLCFGYVSCHRCEAQIGDTLAGSFDLGDHVVVGHDCKTCRATALKLTWRDRYLTPKVDFVEKARKTKRA